MSVDGVELVALAAAAEGGVGPFAVGVVVDEHERRVARQALRDVGGDRVAVLQSGVACAGATLEERSRERPLTVADAQRQRFGGGVDRGDGAAVAVAHVQAAVVAAHDGPVSDGEAQPAGLELFVAQGSEGAHRAAGAGVELGDVAAVVGDHHRGVGIAGRLPVGDEPLEDVGAVARVGDAAVGGVGGERRLDRPVAEAFERRALPGVVLAAVLGELDRLQPGGESGEQAAGGDRGQLVRIADEHELAASVIDVAEQPGCVARAEQAGLVDDEHRSVGQPRVGPVEGGQQRRD